VLKLVAFFVERWVFALAIFLAVAFFGLSAGTRIGVDLLPEFEFPIVAVNVSYPGAGPPRPPSSSPNPSRTPSRAWQG
jgi:hydrophobic/amphiphilic exporter-1 (mainly G- bacteria), HAE1 family